MSSPNKVDFIIIGAMKCGTTTLAALLDLHPEVNFSSRKEPDFFLQDYDESALESYHSLFKGTGLRGEASTSYTKFLRVDIPKRMHAYNPKLKLIYILRDPISRTKSHYQYNKYAKQKNHLVDINESIHQQSNFLNVSRYFSQLEVYLDIFPRDQLLVLTLEEYQNNSSQIQERVADFLNISPKKFPSENLHFNNSNKTTSERLIRLKRKLTSYGLTKIAPRAITRPIKIALEMLFTKKVKPPIDSMLSEDSKEFIINELQEEVVKMEKFIGRKLLEWPEFQNS